MKTLLLSIILTTISFSSFANTICKFNTSTDENISILYNDKVTSSQAALVNKYFNNYKQSELQLEAVMVDGVDYKFIATKGDTVNGVILNYVTEKVIATINDQDINCI